MSNIEPSQLLREQLVEFLASKNIAKNVYDAKAISIDDEELPLIDIFTPSELVVNDLLVITFEIYLFTDANLEQSLMGILDPFVRQVKPLIKALYVAE